MLVTLMRRYSKPYLPYIAAVIVFQLASTIAALYLPSLNAQIIDEGVSRGDTDYIWRTGGLMLVVVLIHVDRDRRRVFRFQGGHGVRP